MRTFKISLASIFCVSLLLSACTEPGETTGIGAATGGVIGAGLGAIVGNQTGNPGSGLVIGGVAGAGAGAAIGNSLEAQQKSVRTQDEALERQQKMLAAQKIEIQELRNMPKDSDSALRGALRDQEQYSHRGSRTTNLNSSSSTSLTDQLNMGADRSDARPLKQSNIESRGAMKPIILQQNYQASEPRPADFHSAEPRAALKPQAPIARSEVSEGRISAALNERTIETNSFNKPKQEIETANVEVESTASKHVANMTEEASAECEKANSEADKASTSNEPADKLFYLRRAIRLCPTDAGFHKRLADEYAQLGRNEDAKASYEEALKLDPKLSEAKKGMAALSSNAY